MPKPQDIFQLAQQEAVRVTASPQAWQSFLYTAAHNYHTTYLNQLLIHAQRPDAAACASMEYWNKQANRLVMRGSRSITVLQRRQGVAVTKPVFAIGDTTLLSQTPTGGPWEVTDTTRPLLLQDKSDDWLTALAQDGVSNDADRARRMLERNVADSTLQWAQSDEQMQLLQALVTQSAVYMARLRIGLPVQDEDYPALQSVSQFDTCQISLCLGGYVQAAAEPMLNAIGREALRLNRDSIAIPHEPVHNESTPTQLNSREEAVTYDVHEEPRRLPDSEPFPAEPAEPVPEPLREAAPGISGAERADALRPADAGGHAADELQSNRTDSTADGGQDPARADADHPDAGPQDEPAGLGTADQQPEEAGGGSSPSDAVRSLTETPAQAESEQSPSAFALPGFPPTLLPQLLAAETSSRASNAEYLTFFSKNPLLIDRLRFVRESYKDIFTELLLADDTRVGFHRQDNGLLVWQGAYLTRSAETLLSWRAVANALNDLIEQHELIATIGPKKPPQAEEQLSFELPDGAPTSAEDDKFEKDDFLTPEKQETVIRSTLPVADYNAPQMDDGSVITDEEINLALAAGSNFENSKFRIYQQFTTTQGDHAAFLKKEYGSGGRSWDYQSGAHGWVDHGPAGLKLILTNEEGRFERRLPWRAAAKRIAYLIEMQRFLTPQELEQYPAWAAEQQEAASAVRDEPGNVPDTRPICTEGSVVYLEDDHRFTVERIGQFDVHLRDEEVPLIGRAISREEFQRQLDANPRNGGMMLSEQQHEALVQTQTEQALSYIEDYLKDEFEITEPDFSDLTRIDLGYTTTEDEKHVIQVYADLEHCTVTKMVDDTLYAQERYGSLDDLNQAVLSNLDFDSLMEIDLGEVEEHEPQENALPTDESAAQAPTNYLAPYEPEIPIGAKAKFATNLNAIRTLKQIEQRGTPATEPEQAIAKTYEVNADEIAAYNRTLTAAGDNKNGKGDGWQPTGRANEYQLAEIFSNDSGNIRVQGLSYGTYLVVETITPHDLFQAEPFLVSIDPEQDNNPWGAMATPKDSVIKASDSYQKFTVLDEEIEVYLKITKLDTETGKPVLLPNTAFQIYWLDDNGSYRLENGKPKLVTMTDTVNGHLTKNVDTFYTNEEGILTLPEKLPLGKYRIVETVGPDGFYNEWADSGNYYVDFDISTDRIYKATGDDNENGMDTLVIGEDYWNEETLGKLTIRKTGNALTGKIEINDLIDPWMTGEADSDLWQSTA